MSQRPVLIPDASHPITVSRAPTSVRVTAGSAVVAQTGDALVLRESHYPAVYYIPRRDVREELLSASEHTTYCPYKGVANYHGLRFDDGAERPNKVWFYAEPHPAVAGIADHLAFYPDVVEFDPPVR